MKFLYYNSDLLFFFSFFMEKCLVEIKQKLLQSQRLIFYIAARSRYIYIRFHRDNRRAIFPSREREREEAFSPAAFDECTFLPEWERERDAYFLTSDSSSRAPLRLCVRRETRLYSSFHVKTLIYNHPFAQGFWPSASVCVCVCVPNY